MRDIITALTLTLLSFCLALTACVSREKVQTIAPQSPPRSHYYEPLEIDRAIPLLWWYRPVNDPRRLMVIHDTQVLRAK